MVNKNYDVAPAVRRTSHFCSFSRVFASIFTHNKKLLIKGSKDERHSQDGAKDRSFW